MAYTYPASGAAIPICHVGQGSARAAEYVGDGILAHRVVDRKVRPAGITKHNFTLRGSGFPIIFGAPDTSSPGFSL